MNQARVSVLSEENVCKNKKVEGIHLFVEFSLLFSLARADFLHEDGVEGPGGGVVGTEDRSIGAALALETKEVGPCSVDVFL